MALRINHIKTKDCVHSNPSYAFELLISSLLLSVLAMPVIRYKTNTLFDMKASMKAMVLSEEWQKLNQISADQWDVRYILRLDVWAQVCAVVSLIFHLVYVHFKFYRVWAHNAIVSQRLLEWRSMSPGSRHTTKSIVHMFVYGVLVRMENRYKFLYAVATTQNWMKKRRGKRRRKSDKWANRPCCYCYFYDDIFILFTAALLVFCPVRLFENSDSALFTLHDILWGYGSLAKAFDISYVAFVCDYRCHRWNSEQPTHTQTHKHPHTEWERERRMGRGGFQIAHSSKEFAGYM